MTVILAILKAFGFVGNVLGVIWKHPVGRWFVIVFAAGLIVFFYVLREKSISHKEGYRQGWAEDSTRAQREYDKLLTALVERDSTLERERRARNPVEIRYRSVPVVNQAAIDSLRTAFDTDRESMVAQFAEMMQAATLSVDTTVQTEDTLDVQLKATVTYYPLSRIFDATFYPYVDLERWRITSGYLIRDTTEIRHDWTFALMGGYSPSGLGGQVSGWYRSYGLGVSWSHHHDPVYWGGYRWRW
jgi:hypothetical protein